MPHELSRGYLWLVSLSTMGSLAGAFAGGIFITLVVGFTSSAWVTGAWASKMAGEAAAAALDDLAAAICVERFGAGDEIAARLTAIKSLQGADREWFIGKGGWASMPGEAEPTKRAAKLCATQLGAFETPVETATTLSPSAFGTYR